MIEKTMTEREALRLARNYMNGEVDRLMKKALNYRYGNICSHFPGEIKKLYDLVKELEQDIDADSYEYNNAFYIGSLFNAEPDGYGFIVWDNHDFYIGEWALGKKCGFGLYYYADRGSLVVGNESCGLRIFKDGSVYIGELKNGKRDGNGCEFMYSIGTEVYAHYSQGRIIRVYNASHGFSVTYEDGGKKRKYIYKIEDGSFKEEDDYSGCLAILGAIVIIYGIVEFFKWLF